MPSTRQLETEDHNRKGICRYCGFPARPARTTRTGFIPRTTSGYTSAATTHAACSGIREPWEGMGMGNTSTGQVVFAATMIGVGVLGLLKPELAWIWGGVPDGMPARRALAYLCALVALACGAGLLWRRTRAAAALILFAAFSTWMLAFKLRFIILQPTVELSYQSCGVTAVLLAAAWVLHVRLAPNRDGRRIAFPRGELGLRGARALYGFAMIAFGLSHFAYLDLTAPLIPAWLLWPVAWAYFTGAAYLAAGFAVLTGVYARLAATLSTWQMGLFLPLVWLPLAATGHISDSQLIELVATCALTAGGWVVAESWRGTPWLSVGKVQGTAGTPT